MTRWNSTLSAIVRLVQLKQQVQYVLNTSKEPIITTPNFWESLEHLITFLTPFKHVTDELQADSATLMTVSDGYFRLLAHVQQTHDVASPMSDAAVDCIDFMEHHWKKQLPYDAIDACRLFCFLPTIQADHIVRPWIINWGSKVIIGLGFANGKSLDEIKANLLVQLIDHDNGTGVFENKVEFRKHVETAAGLKGKEFLPHLYWSSYGNIELAIVACFLISIAPSEACVERSFSVQDIVYSSIRTNMHPATVQAEMMIRMNQRSLSSDFIRDFVELSDQ